jgi:sterol desaturase/sphingolipid hydroxylase (fatty acid hydroxylase superfamily)
MDIETAFGILPLVSFVAMLLVERLLPGRPQPRVRFWVAKGFVFFVITSAVAAGVPAALAVVAGKHAPLDLSSLPLLVAAVVAFVLGDLVNYGMHRLMHNVPLLWRWTHQMHHSAERVDLWGAAYNHPFDIALQAAATTIPVLLLGISPAAAAIAGYIGFVWGVFPHLNIRTPQWLGWFVQRPEAHAVHHTRGVHAYNYAALPAWDMIFRTYRNPVSCDEPAGFWDGASTRVGAMLAGRDVSVET